MLSRLLYLEPAQLRRAWPFFVLYLVLFAALTLADGLSLTLFVQHAGTELLPRYYAFSAIAVLIAVASYMLFADRWGSSTVFQAILLGPVLLLGGVWAAVQWGNADQRSFGWLFIGRELAFALVLLHFGTYLQDYFTRAALNRVMPVIYAGGRVGGIAGGALLEHLAGATLTVNLLLVAAGLLTLGMVAVAILQRRVPLAEEPEPVITSEAQAAQAASELEATQSFGAFLRFVWTNPLLFWITVTTIVYFACRTFLNFRYSVFFESAFPSDLEMARFLGRYTQLALVASMLVQLLFINRWIAWVGLAGAHMTYAMLLLAGALLGSFEMTLASAVFARLVEGELRYCLRNPVSQLIVNQFPKALRLRARAWSLGILIPLSTFVASCGLAWLSEGGSTRVIAILTAALGLAYLLTSLGLVRSLGRGVEADQETPAAGQSRTDKPHTVPSPHALAARRSPAQAA